MKKTILVMLIGVLFCAGAVFAQGIPYVGDWEVFSDVNDGGDSTITMATSQRDGMTAYRFTGNVTTKYQYGFVGWMISPNPATLEALRTARGISFKVLGDGKRYTVKYRISNVRDHAHHEFHFDTVAGQVQTVEVQMRMFQQPAWGNSVGSLNAARMRNVQDISFQTHEGWRPGSYDITVWDVRILQ